MSTNQGQGPGVAGRHADPCLESADGLRGVGHEDGGVDQAASDQLKHATDGTGQSVHSAAEQPAKASSSHEENQLPSDSAAKESGLVDFDTELQRALREHGGVMICDRHGAMDIPRFVTSKMGEFKSGGVKAFFIEMFKSSDQHVLDQFERDGDKQKLIDHLERSGWNVPPSRPDEPFKVTNMFYRLREEPPIWPGEIADMLDAARTHGIRPVGIDTEQVRISSDSERFDRLDSVEPHWADVYRRTMAELPAGSRGVIFGGASHAGNYPAQKGVDALLGIPSFKPFNPVSAKIDTPDLKDLIKPGETYQNPNPRQSNYIYYPPATEKT